MCPAASPWTRAYCIGVPAEGGVSCGVYEEISQRLGRHVFATAADGLLLPSSRQNALT